MSSKKETKELVAKLRKLPGWRIEEIKGGWMAYPPDKSLSAVNIHATPSDHRAWLNTLARLRQRGAVL